MRTHLETPPDGGAWTTPKIAAWMAQDLGLVSVCPQRAWDALQALGWSIQAPRPKNPAAVGLEEQTAFKKTRRHPRRGRGAPSRPPSRALLRGRAPHRAEGGHRPTALGHHRHEWLYVTAFVAPATGESHWYVGNGVSKPLFERLLALFTRVAGAGPHRTIILLLDGAGWHTEPGLAIPDGLRLIYLQPYTPELQPAEHLWRLVDESIINQHFDRLAT